MVDESCHKDHAAVEKIGDSIESVDIRPFRLPEFAGDATTASPANWAAEVTVRLELGRVYLPGDEVLKLSKGSVVSLDSPTTEPVDVYVGGALVARGELQALEEQFCVRVTEVLFAGAKSRAA